MYFLYSYSLFIPTCVCHDISKSLNYHCFVGNCQTGFQHFIVQTSGSSKYMKSHFETKRKIQWLHLNKVKILLSFVLCPSYFIWLLNLLQSSNFRIYERLKWRYLKSFVSQFNLAKHICLSRFYNKTNWYFKFQTKAAECAGMCQSCI